MSKRIKSLRTSKGFTQEELGRLVGVRKAAVQKWESGQTTNLKRSTIEKLAKVFGVTGSYLMAIDDHTQKLDTVRLKKIPMLGTIAAGEPILAEGYCEYYVEADQDINADFCIKVKGDSMINARILDGDLVFIRKQPDVEDGEIAAVLIDGEATLKRVYKMPGRIQLRAENPTYKPMDILAEDHSEVKILGKAVFFQSDVQ